MAKPKVPAVLLKAINQALPTDGPAQAAARRKEADPKAGATEKQSIRPARTSIAHQMGGNKGK
jgi:hypothetical protein